VIGLDTNVLIRALLRDDDPESAAARDLVARLCSPESPAYVGHIVLCEAVWVLARTYRYSREQILNAVNTLLATPAFVIEDRLAVEAAILVFSTSRADFADTLIGVLHRRAGCATTYTFDRRAAETTEFTLVA
jgi:predicted nucleic-acid-binding protein